MAASLDAPIVGVTVFPDRARVTRRGRVTLTAGEHRVSLENLQPSLLADSIRVAGTGPASVLGVDLARRYPAQTPDEVVQVLERAVRDARARLAALDDEDAVAASRLGFFQGLADRSTRSFAAALADGTADTTRVADLADTLGSQQAAVLRQRRGLVEARERAHAEVMAAERELDARRPGAVETAAIDVTLEAPGDGEIELEISYVVTGAQWHSAYDLRLDGSALTLTWYALVTQYTGEDWPECDLRLSTARPSGSASIPELDPWFLDRYRPAPPMPAAAPMMSVGAARAMAPQSFDEAAFAPLVEKVATVEQGATAATYRPARPVAVPADGSAHRATVAVAQLEAALDYVTAPVRAAEAHLRATVTNTSEHTLPSGAASVFHGKDFVGTTRLEIWAPGEEVELALGVDDRIRVERELTERTSAKQLLSSTRHRDAEHRIRITNHTPNRASVTVLDQLPVSRDEAITVKERRLEPVPTERTELGGLTWRLALGPGETRDIHIGIRVELAKGVELVGWRE